MKKNFSFALGSFFVLGMVLFWATNVQSAMTLKVGETEGISFGGYLENLSSLRVGQEENGKNSGFRNVFSPEFLFTFSQDAKLFASARIVKETGYEMEDNIRAKKGLPPLADNFYDETDFEPYELYLDLNLSKKLNLRTGKQFIIWGETDVFTLLDVISPSDSSWIPPAIMALEETRIPQYAARLTYGITPTTNLEFVFVPMIDEVDNRVNKSAPPGGRWAPYAEDRTGPGARASAPKLYPNMMGDFGKAGYFPAANNKIAAPNVIVMKPDGNLDEARVGARLTQVVGNATFTLVDFYGHNYSPVVQYDGVSKVTKRELVESPPGSGTAIYQNNNYYTPNFSVRYLRQNILGGSFNYFDDKLFKAVFRGEVAYYHAKPYNTYDPTVRDAVARKDTISYCLGIDKQFYAPWLNPWEPNRVVFVSAQMFQDVILDHNDDIRFINTATPIDKYTTRFTLQVNTGFAHDTWVPSITMAYDPKGVGVIVPAIIWNPPWSENYFVELKYANYWGDQYEYLGAFNEKDSVFLRLRYMW